MTTTAVVSDSTQGLDCFSQFYQLFSSVGSMFGSITECTDSVFRRVEVQKKDEQGNIKFYPKNEKIVDPQTGETKTVSKHISVLKYTEDVTTGDLYMDEEWYVVAFKCAMLTLGIPIYTVGKMVYNAGWLLYQIGSIAYNAIALFAEKISNGNLSEAFQTFYCSSIQILKAMDTHLTEIVMAPLFGIGCELAAIYGLFKPYHGRKYEAMMEKAWQHNASYKIDLRNVPARPGENCWTAFAKDFKDGHPVYLAHCFQVRGNTHEPRIIVNKVLP